MACSQSLTSIINDCAKSIGGLKIVYAANYSDVTATVGTGGMIDSITMNGTAKFKKFEFRKNTAYMTTTLNVDAANGNSFSTDVYLSFLKQDTAKRLAVSALAIGDLVLIVQDANGHYWYLGYQLPVTASAGGAESGTAFTDGNRYTITLQDVSSDFPYEIDDDTVDINALIQE